MIRVVVGSLAEQAVEGVVRPVQSDFSPVSHASRDLAAAAGEGVEQKLSRVGSLPIGGAVMTPAGNLPCDFLIHVVVSSADEAQSTLTVQRAVQNGLRRVSDMGLTSLALPPLGIGVGMTQPEDAARALCELLFNHLDEGETLDMTLVVSSPYEEEIFSRIVRELSDQRASDT